MSRPREEAVIPLPRLETTPPVTNTNFVTGKTVPQRNVGPGV